MRGRWKDIFIAAIAIVIVFTAHAVPYSIGQRQRAEEQMDAQELHYDADDYFLMLNTANDLAGFYYATTPLKHMWIKTDAPNGTYEAYFHGGEMYLELIGVDATITVPLTRKQAAWIDEYYKDGYPALVYRER